MTDSSGMGFSNMQYWTLTGIAIVALLLVVVNIFTAMDNSKARSEVNERQRFINQSVQLSRLHGQLVQGLAALSAQSDDWELRDVLAEHGITFSIREGDQGTTSGSFSPGEARNLESGGGAEQ